MHIEGKQHGFSREALQSDITMVLKDVEDDTELFKNLSAIKAQQQHVKLPTKGTAEEERTSSMSIFFVLAVVALCILLIHFLLQSKFHYLPESVVVVLLGALVGMILKIFSTHDLGNWQAAYGFQTCILQKEEAFPPNVVFLVFLPPIIFESGYNLHKGNFFQNIGSILVFAIIGTTISALVVGGGVYLFGMADLIYQLNFVESFAFGSLISAVDPVATIAIFHALDVDPVLNMLVFGESILNDAVAIVLTMTALEIGMPSWESMTLSEAFFHGMGRFGLVFFASAAIGVMFALISALISFSCIHSLF
ncbi:unnamed protein product [Darwinula stevensoni]|uniref:Sodium/hydrogen exchanger 8 n=1 Tax=Darwinula stevensoni TaxID=69355 RepID=A0A7R8X184_9CRUS|nr:unnamed protein product [Darwinula stevensoni]CAG0882539.1 unnamed protein product [Darwinula stevensoni]